MRVRYIKVQISTKMHILSMTVCGLEIECLSNAMHSSKSSTTVLVWARPPVFVHWAHMIAYLVRIIVIIRAKLQCSNKSVYTAPGVRCIRLPSKLRLQRQDQVIESLCSISPFSCCTFTSLQAHCPTKHVLVLLLYVQRLATTQSSVTVAGLAPWTVLVSKYCMHTHTCTQHVRHFLLCQQRCVMY